MKRATWGSRAGFIFAVAGSAVGLANIWRLPYVVGENGGAAFLLVYLLCLILIGFPVFMAEMVIGRTTQTNPSGAFAQLGGSEKWRLAGKLSILTGLIVSSFYGAVASWILGYLFEAVAGNITHFSHAENAIAYYTALTNDPLWGIGFHSLFLGICVFVLYSGVRNGIERGNKIMMPLLLLLLLLLVIKGLLLPNAMKGIRFLLYPDWSELTPMTIIVALGQAFFTLSLGQGTMVTYGSYLDKKSNLVKNCFPVVLMDTGVSLLAAFAIFSIVFAGNMEPDSGPGLIFHTLPIVFGQIQGGYFVAVMFFFLVLLTAITSQISAMEPAIAYLMDERGWKRHGATAAVGAIVFFLGIPSTLSFSVLKNFTFSGMNFFELISFAANSILIPLGGFLALILVGWVWGVQNAMNELKVGAANFYEKYSWLHAYFWFCLKFSAPILMILVFLNALGTFG